MSASALEIQALYQLLELVEQKMREITRLAGASDLATTQTRLNEVRITQNEIMILTNQMLITLRRMGLPENLSVAMAALQRLIVFANAARMAMLAFQASNPVGLAIAGLGVASSVISMGDMAGRYG
jgi:hypothetical protein